MDSKDKIYLVMEYQPGGELFDYILSQDNISESDARVIFRDLVRAVHYCHSNGVIHRDLKPENVLFDEHRNVKLCDFGFAHIIQNDGKTLETFCGSPAYAAPEMVARRKYIGPEVDIWSLGVILFTMTCGRMPFDDRNLPGMFAAIMAGKYVIPPKVSPQLRDLIQSILKPNVEKRATLEQIRLHPWINLNCDQLAFGVSQEFLRFDLLKYLTTLGLSEELVKKFKDTRELGPVRTAYYLLLPEFVKDHPAQLYEHVDTLANDESTTKSATSDENLIPRTSHESPFDYMLISTTSAHANPLTYALKYTEKDSTNPSKLLHLVRSTRIEPQIESETYPIDLTQPPKIICCWEITMPLEDALDKLNANFEQIGHCINPKPLPSNLIRVKQNEYKFPQDFVWINASSYVFPAHMPDMTNVFNMESIEDSMNALLYAYESGNALVSEDVQKAEKYISFSIMISKIRAVNRVPQWSIAFEMVKTSHSQNIEYFHEAMARLFQGIY